ncbi:MocR-like pyridoxine biosynthesis transcription factor PdxR [Pseudonocardia phyllosphaerae]|uniref:MocR-like pyridoxine biosynthesis transcription factor PdxR n=1 Tax=Pseudonocardia phyllosphaerae TaxID=3390502 RepID=UPI00397C83CF
MAIHRLDRKAASVPTENVPPLPLDRASPVPLAAQLADRLRDAASGGTLRPGDRLPSTRTLATALDVSRTVTAAAYDQLLAEGWVAGRTGSGTYVTNVPAAGTGPAAPQREPRPAADTDDPGPRYSLFPGRPCVAALDPAMWRRAWRAAADPDPDDAPLPDGVPAFRAAVAEHLLRHRGLTATTGDVLATAGTSAAVAELARILPAGATVAVEEPGYRRAVSALRAAGLAVAPVPVDADGLVVEQVPPGCAAVYCTPAHQFPLAVRMAAERRVALVERARAEDLLVIEDDYDGELRYDVAPLPLLAALAPERVVHLGTSSKIVSPTLGAGWAVAPPAVRDAWLRLRSATGTRPSPAGQRVFAALAAHGDLARHLRRLRRELRARREDVLAAAARAGLPASGDPAGAHLVLELPGAEAERETVAGAPDVHVTGLADYYEGPPAASGLVVGFAAGSRTELATALQLLLEPRPGARHG